MLQILTAIPEENVKVLLHPWQLLLLVLAGWVNRRQQDVIEYLLVENRVLRQKLGKRRILLRPVLGGLTYASHGKKQGKKLDIRGSECVIYARYSGLPRVISGASMHYIQSALGHGSVVVTERYYVKYDPKSAAQQLLRLIAGGKKEMGTQTLTSGD
jgi:hypothetical protein